MKLAIIIATIVVLVTAGAALSQPARTDPTNTDITSTLAAIQTQLDWLKQELTEQRNHTTELESTILQNSEDNLKMLAEIRDRLGKVEVEASGYGLLGGILPALGVAIYVVIDRKRRNDNTKSRG